MSTKITKADVIAELVEKGHARNGLQRLTLAGLQAMLAEPSPQPEKAEEPAAAPAPSPTGDLLLAAEEVAVGDTYCGITILEAQAATKWVYLRSDAGWFFQVLRGTPVQIQRAA